VHGGHQGAGKGSDEGSDERADARRIPAGVAAAAVVVALAAVNVLDDKVPHATLVVGPACAVVLPLTGRAAGLSWDDLGLGRSSWRTGMKWAGVEVALTAVVLAAGAALPLTRNAFRDSRYHLSLGGALLTSFVLIPVGTVLLEEIAFRSVLWGLLRRAFGTATATVVSSLLFGLWHALPSLGLASDNLAVTDTVGRGRSAELITVLATMAFTGCAGVVFCELRRRSGSVLAPAGLHWAVNGLAVLASAAVWAWATP
jgi:membrane protease YdiL (CAAX protease family)